MMHEDEFNDVKNHFFCHSFLKREHQRSKCLESNTNF